MSPKCSPQGEERGTASDNSSLQVLDVLLRCLGLEDDTDFSPPVSDQGPTDNGQVPPAASSVAMIARGHCSALQFTKDMTRNLLYLERYFKELEAALANTHITESRHEKEYAIHYPDVEQAEAWKALTEYDSDESDYDTFKKAIRRIYFGDNYSEHESSRTIWRAFDPRLMQAVQTHLDIKCLDADDDIYPLEEVIAAAKFCCRGGKRRSMMMTSSARTILPNEGGMVKIEDISTLRDSRHVSEGKTKPTPPHPTTLGQAAGSSSGRASMSRDL
ncbi:hypothetical protein FISHEDRAFT_74176 [Fistulina hepatica ATCC 64428]|uniref:Uncharacterized protein n=1 Tax=Fistulina hepatica ATCC 64428 TaxID=1128425 RepID=A0A0D7ABR1_9AGAR|nr:hypothetical protein FISHEDRAFT_74176 [Fistulina hepatica ATCC 64428]